MNRKRSNVIEVDFRPGMRLEETTAARGLRRLAAALQRKHEDHAIPEEDAARAIKAQSMKREKRRREQAGWGRRDEDKPGGCAD